MLNWFVDKTVVQDAIDGNLIEEDQVECQPQKIPNSVLDENVNVHLVRPYFTDDAWWKGKQNLQLGFVIHAIMICIHRLWLYVSHAYNDITFGVLESQHSQKRRTGFVILVLSSYSVDYHTCCIIVTAK